MVRAVVLTTALLGFFGQMVMGHYQLTYPAARGFSETTEPTGPCGGFNTAGNRSQFPLQNGFLEVNSEHTSYSYQVYFSAGENPTAFNTSIQIGSGQVNYPAQSCWAINFPANAGISNGTVGTIQAIYNAGDGMLYQCADVVVVSSPANFNTSACVNADGSKPNLGSSNSSSSSSSPASAGTQVQVGAVVMGLSSVLALALAL